MMSLEDKRLSAEATKAHSCDVDNTQAMVPRRIRQPAKPVDLRPGDILHVVKHKNRRLYSSTLHRFVSLKEIGEHWDRGALIFATWQKRPDVDITSQVLLELLLQRTIAGQYEMTPERLRALVSPATSEPDQKSGDLVFLEDAYNRSRQLIAVLRLQVEAADRRTDQLTLALRAQLQEANNRLECLRLENTGD
jgi:hypothetical protein